MKLEVSAFIDGALDESVAKSTLDALKNQPDLRQAWDTYHLIGDALRRSPTISQDFAGRVMHRLAAEPTVIASMMRRPSSVRRLIVPLAASVMGVAGVGWVAQSLNSTESVQVAVGARPQARAAANVAVVMPVQAPQHSAVEVLAVQHAAPQVREYLFAHQGYSPRSNIQGVGHYLRSFSDSGQSAAK